MLGNPVSGDRPQSHWTPSGSCEGILASRLHYKLEHDAGRAVAVPAYPVRHICDHEPLLHISIYDVRGRRSSLRRGHFRDICNTGAEGIFLAPRGCATPDTQRRGPTNYVRVKKVFNSFGVHGMELAGQEYQNQTRQMRATVYATFSPPVTLRD